MKTSELTGAALDWAVAKCEGVTEHSMGHWKLPILEACTAYQYSPSTKWAQGGPIIEREKIALDFYPGGWHEEGVEWLANINPTTVDLDIPLYEALGPTPLISAMRCYVASKLGDEVTVPEELT